jgi:type I restriction enzyme, S subunit
VKAGWQIMTLGEVCALDKRQGLQKELPYVGLEHIESHTGRFIGSKEPLEVKSSTFKFTPEHLLYGRLRPYLNKVLLPDFTGHCSTEIIPIKPCPGISREFLQYWFLRDATVQRINETSTGARMPRANMSAVLDLKLLLPPLPEQRRIVAILDEAFAGIARGRANTEKNLQNARALFESYLQSVFTQRGEEWVEKRLGEMSERITKGSSPKWQGIAYTDRPGILFITSENVSEYQIMLDQPKYVEERFNKREKKSILKKGDVLTNIVGASIGRTAVFDRDEVANINQAVCLIRCEPDLLNNFFLTYLLNSPLFKQVLHDNEVNNARANLSLGFFSHLLVPTPPIPVQSKIVAKVGALRAETQRLESIYQRKLAALDELKKSLLQQAFSGEL